MQQCERVKRRIYHFDSSIVKYLVFSERMDWILVYRDVLTPIIQQYINSFEFEYYNKLMPSHGANMHIVSMNGGRGIIVLIF